jgi:hypothetical protein
MDRRALGHAQEGFLKYNLAMPITVWGVVRDGKIEPDEALKLPEGAKVLVMVWINRLHPRAISPSSLLTADTERQFWLETSQSSLNKIWDNPQDEVYAELLQR